MKMDGINRIPRIRVWAMLCLVALASACSFDADNPAGIDEGTLNSPEALRALVNGVMGDYDHAFSRSVLYSGLLSDELRASGTYPTWRAADREGIIDVDAAAVGMANLPADWWGALQSARFLAEDSYTRVDDLMAGPQGTPLLATARLYSGLAYRDIGEYFCAAAYDLGPRVEREQSLEIARTHLSEAIVLGTEAGVDSLVSMAHLARARVNLSLGDVTAALADARAVPDGFRMNARFHTANPNETYIYLVEQPYATVQEEFWVTADPRVPVEDTGQRGLDGITPRHDPLKYSTRTSPMPIGKWQEARLIEAEILLDRGQVGDALEIMDGVRAAAGLPSLGSLSADEAREALHNERALELFLEGQRMLDMRRWDEFPAGWGASCVPIPRSETDYNPNL